MNNLRNIFFNAVLIVATFSIMNIASAQPPPGDGGGEDPDAGSIPIDGGIGVLAAAGVAYGITALRKKKTTAE